jgi:hypothetical protein
MVGHRPGNPAGPQLEVGHPAAAELQQNPDIRAIRRNNIPGPRQLPGIEILVHNPSISVPQTRP